MIRLHKNFRMHPHQSPYQICDKNKAREITIYIENIDLQIISMILLFHSRIKQLHKIVYDLDADLVYPEPTPYDYDDKDVDPIGSQQDISHINGLIEDLQNLENSITLDLYHLIFLVFSINIEQGSKKKHTSALYRLYKEYKNVIDHRSCVLGEYSKLFNNDLDIDHRSIMISNILCNVPQNDYNVFITCFEAEIYNLLYSC